MKCLIGVAVDEQNKNNKIKCDDSRKKLRERNRDKRVQRKRASEIEKECVEWQEGRKFHFLWVSHKLFV